MADEYISRDAVLNASKIAYVEYIEIDGEGYEEADAESISIIFKKDIAAIPAADVAPAVHAHWEIADIYTYKLSNGTTAYEPAYECSACKRLTESYLRLDVPMMPEEADFPRYCPNCGAKMSNEEAEE